MNIKCGNCNSKKHGAMVEDNFACFKCMLSTSWGGSTHGISRVPDSEFWNVQVDVRQSDGSCIQQWIPVSDDFETAYVRYVNTLIVT